MEKIAKVQNAPPAESTPSDDSDLFIKSSTVCPICEAVIKYRYIKPRLYVDRDKEVDLRPRSIQWLKKGIKGYYPRLYHMRHCPQCYFTADSDLFKNPVKGTSLTLTMFSKKLSACLRDNPSLHNAVNMLSTDINAYELDFLQAFKLHFLAILLLQQIDEIADQDATYIGKYCLRLAWLYRDIQENDDLKEHFAPQLITLIRSIKNDWPKIPASENIALKRALHYYQTSLQKSHTIETVYHEVSMLLLIARIYLKLGNIEKAHQMLALGQSKARNFEQQAITYQKKSFQQEKRARGGKTAESKSEPIISEARITEMIMESRKMKLQVNEARRVFEDIRDEHEQQQMNKATKVIDANKDKTPQELRQLLLDNKVEQRVVDRLYPPEPVKKQKKGLFALFG